MIEFLPDNMRLRIIVVFVCCILICVASFIDMWTGIDAAKANKEKISSHGLRKTMTKITDYLRILMFALLPDVLGLFFSWYTMPYVAVLVTLGALGIEGISVVENSKKKKSSAGNIVDMISKIVECASEKDATALLTEIQTKLQNDKKHE